ncbi:MAG: hypothetical protein ACSHX8_12810 [Opitutaceae bacterium]
MSDKALTKNGLAWLVTRLIGCWFAWLVIKGFFVLLYAFVILNSAGWDVVRSSGAERMSWDIAWPRALCFFIYAGVAYYFLRRGTRFVSLICNEGYIAAEKEASQLKGIDAWIAKDDSRRYLSKDVQRREYLASQQDG